MGLIHLDAGVVIALLDGQDIHHDAATSFLTSARLHNDRLALSATAFAECLVQPFRHGEKNVQVIRELVNRVPVSIVNLDEQTAEQSARLRASHRNLRLPDAIVIATAMISGADQLVTTDRQWPSATAMKFDGVIQRL